LKSNEIAFNPLSNDLAVISRSRLSHHHFCDYFIVRPLNVSKVKKLKLHSQPLFKQDLNNTDC